jgi:Predicted transcriptional regulators
MASTTMGQRLKAARLAKGLTQTQLAKIVKLTSHSVICDYELGKRGRRRPDLELLIKISKALDVSLDYLILGADSSHPK